MEDEKVIYQGTASFMSLFTFRNLILSIVTGFIYTIYVIIQLAGTRYKITSSRIHVTRGIISKTESEIELYRVKDIKAEQSAVQRMLANGNITVVSSDSTFGTFQLNGIPRPSKIREEIRAAVHQSRLDHNVRISERLD